MFCKPLSDARHVACLASIHGQPHDPAHLTFDAFVATTQQRHGQQSDDDATHIAHAHPKRVKLWLRCVVALRRRVAKGHALNCRLRTTHMPFSAAKRAEWVCDCGHDDDVALLAELEVADAEEQ